MNIQANQVRVGDYVHGIGTVKSIRTFCEERSVHGRTRTHEESGYISSVMNEVDACYSSVPGHVVIEATLGSRSFLASDPVDVMRISARKVKSEAA
jgi:hypothetical protein